MICLTLDLNSPDNFDIETIKISFRRLRQSYANDRRLVKSMFSYVKLAEKSISGLKSGQFVSFVVDISHFL